LNTTLGVPKAGLAAQRMVSSMSGGTSEGAGQYRGCGRWAGISGSGGGAGGFFACTTAAGFAGLAEAGKVGLLAPAPADSAGALVEAAGGKVGLLVPALADSAGAFAEVWGLGLLLLSFDELVVAAFFLADAGVRFAFFEDVAHAGASSKNAQLPSRQY
jgi:hypothetical protein